MATVKLSAGYSMEVDDIDLRHTTGRKWSASVKDGDVYAMATIDRQAVRFHRYLMGKILGRALTSKEDVDHKDTNTLNNTRENLRVTTRSQNLANQKIRKNNTSGYKGVYKRGNRYATSIMHEYKRVNIGCFATAELAAQAYNDKALELFGEHARLNEIKA